MVKSPRMLLPTIPGLQAVVYEAALLTFTVIVRDAPRPMPSSSQSAGEARQRLPGPADCGELRGPGHPSTWRTGTGRRHSRP